MKKTARTSPEFLKDSAIYQMYLRPFTPEGTLDAATKMLPHVAELGIDVVYLCPIVAHDDDMREEFWSDRQHKSELKNPKNPYRLKDYYNIDEEYGTDEDLKRFVKTSHDLGMKVILDLVYFHCGPTAVFLEEHPDFVKRDEEGNIKYGSWHFPELNFESQGLREHLWENMEYFMKEFKVDGYRCDVAPAVPLDFWVEGRKRMEAIDPECFMISEGDREDDQLSAFDLNYAFKWKYGIAKCFEKEITATELRDIWQKLHDDFPEGARFLRILEDHDIVNDRYEDRYDRKWGNKGVDAALVINLMMDGVPMIYNGQEIADPTRHSIYSNRFIGKNMLINWANALREEGINRFELMQSLINLRRSIPALTEGDVNWLENDQAERIISFQRPHDQSNVVIVVNTGNSLVSTTVNIDTDSPVATPQIQYGADYQLEENLKVNLLPYGYIILEYK